MLDSGIFALEFKNSNLKFVISESLTHAMNFGIGSAFSKGSGSAFSEGPGLGPLYKLCHDEGLSTFTHEQRRRH